MCNHGKSSLERARVLLLILSSPCCACALQQPALQLVSQDQPLLPAAVYRCSAITQEQKCVSAVADDTAHLSENPNAHIVQTNGVISLTKARKALAVEFYIAKEKTLLGHPKYTKLHPAQGTLTVPPDPERRVLIAIYPNGQKVKTKVVWLLAPTQ